VQGDAGTGIMSEEGEIQAYVQPWVSSMYWAVTTMSTIGYGDISPGTGPERMCGMFLMTIGLFPLPCTVFHLSVHAHLFMCIAKLVRRTGCAFFAWVTGSITQLMTLKPACQTRFDDLLDDVNTFMKSRKMPEGCSALSECYRICQTRADYAVRCSFSLILTMRGYV
jgi:hypothetical protein